MTGADQLVSEVRTGPVAFTHAYTYDHNGNRLTQTSNGVLAQSFTYDAHDNLTSGSAYNETDGYDLNGNETTVTINGGTYHDTYDDEDRLVSVAVPGGPTDTFVYNGLGLRVGKADSTGTYSYLCDGATPASPVLTDGHAVYTPGLSENRGGAISYPAFDQIGNLWTQDGSGPSQFSYEDTTGFGSLTSAGGSTGSPFKFGGGNGCQTDADTGLVLMGHRVYDSRLGRFLSQDPIGDGDNWYAYCGNDPVDGVDPDGLFMQMPSTGETMAHDGMMGFLGGLSFGGSGMGGDGSYTKTDYTYTRTRSSQPGTGVIGPWGPWQLTDEQSTTFDMGGGTMFAQTMSESTNPPGQVLLGQMAQDGVGVGRPGLQNVTSDITGPLVKEAEAAGKSVQGGLDHLSYMLRQGSLNAGKGFRAVKGVKGILEMRAQDGARLYLRVTQDGYQIVGKSAKFNQDKVINILRGIYGK